MGGSESNKEYKRFTFVLLLLKWVGFTARKEKQKFSEKTANCEKVKLMEDGWN